jgi:hypothetical protein
VTEDRVDIARSWHGDVRNDNLFSKMVSELQTNVTRKKVLSLC